MTPYETRITAPVQPDYEKLLSREALGFIADLAVRFGPRIAEAIERRAERRKRLAAGATLDFLADTADVRADDWKVAPLPQDLLKRTVEITGPVDPKMVINALNSGADVFMADFEDSNAPSWENQLQGQWALYHAVRRDLTFHDAKKRKDYKLDDELAVLKVRPRGLHLPESHMRVNGEPVPGSLFDFGLFFFHNAAEQVRRGTGPYFYLPKMESHLEARIWNDVFIHAQRTLGLPQGTIKATCLIETLPAAFEMDEILYELRDHSAGLNCGRWDYIFSHIKTLRHDPGALLPDRSQVSMTQPCMRAYAQLAIKTCHRRGVHAIGGMAAQIPIKNDPAASEAALAKVRADKEREVTDGHDGTWVAHPGLVPIAREVFEAHMKGDNQLDRLREDVQVSAADLLQVPTGTRTEEGLRLNVRVGVQYLEAWLRGTGCVPLYHLMEDAATAEISRTQIWHWMHHNAALEDGRPVTRALVEAVLREEMTRVENELGSERFEQGMFPEAVELFMRVATDDALEEFLTLPAYSALNRIHDDASSPANGNGSASHASINDNPNQNR